MITNEEKAKYIWNAYFGEKTKTKDAFNRTISKNKFGKEKDPEGWTLNRVWPENPDAYFMGTGPDWYSNLQPLHYKSEKEKGSKLSGTANQVAFKVVEINNSYGWTIGRMKIEKNHKFFWAYQEPQYS